MKELFLLGFTPLIGAFIVLRIKGLQRVTKLLLTFSGAYLLSLVVLHILPDLYQKGSSQIGLFILGGFFLQVLLDYFSKGLEHGHVHLHKNGSITGVLIGLYLHSLIEGIPLGMGYHEHYEGSASLFWGIILHKMPVSIVLTALLINRYSTSKKIWGPLLLFALTGMTGYGYGYYFGDWIPLNFEHLMAIVVGIFLHVGTTIIFESADSHRLNFEKLIAIFAGFVLSAILIGA